MAALATFTRALTRGVPASFAQALSDAPTAIDLSLAISQHEAYVQLLRQQLCLTVTELPADDRFPDCVFVEDTALAVSPDTAVVTRPGAPSRNGEQAAVAAGLEAAGLRILHEIEAPGSLDGGDVLQVGELLLVGLSKRTNQHAVSQLMSALRQTHEVVALPVAHGLHLKSALTALDGRTLLAAGNGAGRDLARQVAEHRKLRGRFAIESVPDPLAANVLRSGEHVVLQAGLPASQARLQWLCDDRGLRLHLSPAMTEVAKADGALTCCSILI